MLDRFKSRYPNGSLIRELLDNNDGNYIITVILIASEKIKAIATAQAESIELAEKKAVEFAMVILELEENYLIPNKPVLRKEKQFPQIINKPIPFQTKSELISSMERMLPRDASLTPSEKNNEDSELELEKIDFIDVFQEVDREMARLQWTKDYGRKILKAKYGKRSRYSLEDEELLEFLEFLKNQPEP